ncbi:MAG: methyltransferase domain-containing protein [Pseudomonadota bacterium]
MASKPPKGKENYLHDYEGVLTARIIGRRSAQVHGAFVLPYLRDGMALLDCGCGPGSITIGLAQAIPQGHVTGIDLAPSQVKAARATASVQGVGNVTFESCDVYQLPFPDRTFDGVFSHALMEHMSDPLAVLKEMRRVLKPGGIAAIRSIDLGGTVIAPEDAAVIRAHDLWVQFRRYCGGDPLIGRRLRGWLRQGGFSKTIGTMASETWGTAERCQAIASIMLDEFTGPRITKAALQEGWADQARMDEAAQALKDWGEHPDALMSYLWGEAVGWK